MIGYIYRITNTDNNKCYVGITIDFNNRREKHIHDLNNNSHHSVKLQKDWNIYGADKFEFSVREVKIQEYEDLYELEIEENKKFNSYENGYNCNKGGGISDWKKLQRIKI